jgi:hypothetical protein
MILHGVNLLSPEALFVSASGKKIDRRGRALKARAKYADFRHQ